MSLSCGDNGPAAAQLNSSSSPSVRITPGPLLDPRTTTDVRRAHGACAYGTCVYGTCAYGTRAYRTRECDA